jgi:Ca-activated chloride channel homolog
MKFMSKGVRYLILLALLLAPLTMRAATTASDEDKTLSPYFVIMTENADVEQFSLKSTSADVSIAGVIADVKVTQVYQNRGKVPLECIYIFPASTRAAVYAMKMTIGERTIIAKIEEKKKAREDYEKAKAEGKSASLLEQQRPNVFQMNVANIMPGDEIKVEMQYTELLVPTDGVYEFAYPTVVGPRYSNEKESAAPDNSKWVKNPYLHEGATVPYDFDINVGIAAGMSIADVTCDSHKVNVSYDNPATAKIKLDASEKAGGNRDYILRYRLEGGKIQSGLLLYKGEKENFFLLMMQPPKKVAPKEIPPREYIFIVDVSGSMYGFPLDISKKLMKDLIGNLKPTDKFNVMFFSGGNAVLAEKSLDATPENLQKAIDMIDKQQGGGGTEILPALKRALALPGPDNVSRTMVIVTDGYVSVEKECFDLIRSSLGQANMFAFGIGSSVNRFIIEGMAHVGNGEPFIIENPEKAPAIATKFRELIQTPVLTKIKVDYSGFNTYDVEPMSIPDILAEKPVVIYGKYKGEPSGKITLKGETGSGEFKTTVDVGGVKPQESNAALRYLWARKRIQILDDYNKLASTDERVKEVTNLGLTYNLLTAYTSFIAIDTEVRNKEGKNVTVKQPLPLPEGVSDYAVGEPGASSGSRGGGMMKYKSMSAPSPMKKDGNMATLPAETEADDKAEEPAKPPIPKPQPAAAISLDTVIVTAGLEKGDVETVFNQEKANLEKCLQAALAKSPGLSGKVTFKIDVDASGKVTKVRMTAGSLSSTDATDCLSKALNGWSLPKPKDGQTVTITITFKVQ